MYILLLRVYNFSFTAIAACMFNWIMDALLRKQEWSIWLITPVLKRKRNMESTM